MDLGAIVIIETWLTGNVSDHKMFGDVTTAGYSFNYAESGTIKSAFFSLIL